MTHISLGDDDFVSGLKCTPAKRKLDTYFVSCQVGYSISAVKLDGIVEVGDNVQLVCGLVPVKIEKD